jgi:hypothetical protein
MAPLALCVRGAGGSTLSGRTTQLNGLKRAFSRVTCQGWGGSVRHGAVHGSEHRLGYSNDDCAEGARVFFTEAMNLPNQAPDRPRRLRPSDSRRLNSDCPSNLARKVSRFCLLSAAPAQRRGDSSSCRRHEEALMRGRCVCTAFRSSHARLGAANPEKWHRYSVRKGAPTARVPSLGCLAALDRGSEYGKVAPLHFEEGR